ncbi:peptide MFS transporter [Corynebacterium ureicelerivorans]|uniref:Major facilitator transporter n=1 Tax=Corynebacterium ureicelerivorans TaxID=401472 RepID=A0A077HIQ8_9CORY|nr:peptide MFS transporter [Corynebacterium ureicelerivorans]AIL96923.1 major facilitator transporter [Corynebacterium ureicelerivorans]
MSTQTQPGADTPRTERTFFGQPWGLANLFGIELWERFSFYGMQALLAFYMYYATTEGGLGIDRSTALSLVGAYGGFVYMMALVASFVGDRLLGPERTLYYSAILVMIGHVMLALVPGAAGLAIGLVCVGIGSGGVKTAAQVVLGDLYSREDPRRDAGFSVFYMAINIGALFGHAITGWVWGMAGFHWGFGLAAIGMAIGLVQYTVMRKSTIGAVGSEVPNPLPRSEWAKWGLGVAGIALVLVSLLTTGILPLDWLSWVVFAVALVATVVLLSEMYASDEVTDAEKSRLTGYIPLLVGSVAFFAIFQSQFTVVAVYADQRADLSLFKWVLEPAQVQSFNPLFIIIFAPIFATMWTKLGERQWASATKFGVANIIIGLSLFIFLPYVGKGEQSTPLLVLVVILFLFTIGELFLSPVGNSLATKVAPQAFKSRLFAVWLMSVSMGTALSGVLGSLYNPDDAVAERTFFLTLSAITIVLGAFLIAIRRWVVRKFGDIR